MVLYEVSYDGRPLFYRACLGDMTVPYMVYEVSICTVTEVLMIM